MGVATLLSEYDAPIRIAAQSLYGFLLSVISAGFSFTTPARRKTAGTSGRPSLRLYPRWGIKQLRRQSKAVQAPAQERWGMVCSTIHAMLAEAERKQSVSKKGQTLGTTTAYRLAMNISLKG
jgi:hypothetical protein